MNLETAMSSSLTSADGAQPELFIFNELCAQRDDSGPCKAILERFFFSVETGSCEPFVYGGCGGNANNFDTLEVCEEMCVVSDDKNPCHLPEAPGPCRALLSRYFFDSKTQRCKQFYYGGCYGNANNFKTLEQCQVKCQNPVKLTKAPEVLTQLGIESRIVQPTVLTGKTECKPHSIPRIYNMHFLLICVLKPTEPCSSPVDRGTCDGAERRFAYNPKVKKCQVFSYSGCGGNENNFILRRDCAIKCRSRKAHGRMIRIRKKNINSIVNRSV
uniref:Tissue factor pathway inhibitor n=1 Tax=Mola mola TaxID=94237 RepID=A0A3Q4AQC2_MOLML